jgi:hypothetical protein
MHCREALPRQPAAELQAQLVAQQNGVSKMALEKASVHACTHVMEIAPGNLIKLHDASGFSWDCRLKRK